jgi:hypothetical protein
MKRLPGIIRTDITLTKEVVVTISVYQMIPIMANHIHMLMMRYMEQSMRLLDLVSRLDWIIYTINVVRKAGYFVLPFMTGDIYYSRRN